MKQLAAFALALVAAWTVHAHDKVLRMVYKESGKPPYMQAAPDSSGLYLDLVSAAATRIGYRVEMVRVPKARSYQMLKRGAADLYPALAYNTERGAFLAYLRSGLHRDESYFGLTATGVPDLRGVADIKQFALTWIYERGSSLAPIAEAAQVPHTAVNNLTLGQAVTMIRSGRPVFYRVVDEDYDDYLEHHHLKSLDALGVQIHKNCFAPLSAPLYVGFSKASPLYREETNPGYDKTRPLSATNLPYRLRPGSVPFQLGKAMDEMVRSGEVALMLKKYGVSQ